MLQKRQGRKRRRPSRHQSQQLHRHLESVHRKVPVEGVRRIRQQPENQKDLLSLWVDLQMMVDFSEEMK